MSLTVKRRYLALALSAALIAVPVSIAAASAPEEGNDGYTPSSGPTGENAGYDAYQPDGTTATPTSDTDTSSDSHTDPQGSDPANIPCSTYDPCTGGL